ncbi:hypothetical protein RFI_14493 [Reticulomyxa filosa]|uniref:HotDog ACOT-type domain-containing protein n=1 Tax=Reticulomyxa filosa TaxID=46433 RepID=X6N9G7_RETFI|nr:hypothetical protein RFI_14493 [Reticulomyxa filosa]|eukprot:ETO22701.1 hypothetical protein RFI_14493 [Reticulomyxa filosa]
MTLQIFLVSFFKKIVFHFCLKKKKNLGGHGRVAGNIAQIHAQNEDNYPANFVTASVDRIDLMRRFPMTRNLSMSGCVTHIGNSSCQVMITIADKQEPLKICTANFVMVCTDPYNDNKPMKINRLKLETDEEKQLFTRGEFESELRKKQQLSRLRVTKPTDEESQVIHDLWKKQFIDKTINVNVDPHLYCTLKSTRVEHTTICQPQELNRNGKIFGGYLMRGAYELSRACAFRFAGYHNRPIFASSDGITFENPVSVGSVIQHEGYVCCTDSGSGKRHAMEIVVRTHILEPRTQQEDKTQNTTKFSDSKQKFTNIFSFTYIAPKSPLRQVVPETYTDAIWKCFVNLIMQIKFIAILKYTCFVLFNSMGKLAHIINTGKRLFKSQHIVVLGTKELELKQDKRFLFLPNLNFAFFLYLNFVNHLDKKSDSTAVLLSCKDKRSKKVKKLVIFSVNFILDDDKKRRYNMRQ